MVQGPHYNYPLPRIRPIDPDRQDDPRDNKKGRALYQGRAWVAGDGEQQQLSIKHAMQAPAPEKVVQKKDKGKVFGDHRIMERAEALFKKLTTLEEKAAQLCFLATEAFYETEDQHRIELLIQTWRIGGLLFTKGDYRRQAYLIEKYQGVAKTPLLMANSFLYSLSLHFEGSANTFLTEQHFFDMGKVIMTQNKRLGVHIQFDRAGEREAGFPMDEPHAKAFRKGIREVQGVVGKEKSRNPQQGSYPILVHREGALHPMIGGESPVQETIGLKTLTFLDASQRETNLADFLLQGFKEQYDLFIFSANITDGVRALCQLVTSGKLREEILDRHILKALAIKSLFFK